MYRIAHVSDPHVLSPAGAEWREMLFNKRLTGYANLMLRRGRVHRREYLTAVLEGAARASDHVVVTGDVTNLALESEYDEARMVFDEVARQVEVTIVPGNHDIYLPTTHHERRFPHHFHPFLRSDLPELAADLQAGPFPCVKLRGPVALIALSSAVPRPPFVAAGYLGEEQLEALTRVLAHPEVARRTPVILIHHPPVDERRRLAQLRDGLVDAAAMRKVLDSLSYGLVLFGHLHVRVRCSMRTASGALEVIGASGAALDHPDRTVRAGFNLYEFDDAGALSKVEAHVVNASGLTLERREIPMKTSCA
jgi:3',5'-cyclic AMP phosphodiesterase CpdA